MMAVFDQVAAEYDVNFTQTTIGRLQRLAVWEYLESHILTDQSIDILELNCGTGYDALRFARKGHMVLATDQSSEMINQAKSATTEVLSDLHFETADIRGIRKSIIGQYDLVFSNFGGLNCLSPEELSRFLEGLPQLLKPNGRFIAVVMPRFCLMESIYFFLSGKWSKVFRRMTRKAVTADLLTSQLSIWYYTAFDFNKTLKATMRYVGKRGIGTIVPPSYLESKMPDGKSVQLIRKLDRLISKWPLAAGFSDHFLIDFKLRS